MEGEQVHRHCVERLSEWDEFDAELGAIIGELVAVGYYGAQGKLKCLRCWVPVLKQVLRWWIILNAAL
jgi:hypothetical protein